MTPSQTSSGMSTAATAAYCEYHFARPGSRRRVSELNPQRNDR
jgi:hypothetical protein